jgi:hypothetical protein
VNIVQAECVFCEYCGVATWGLTICEQCSAYQAGAAVAFGIIGMFTAMRENRPAVPCRNWEDEDPGLCRRCGQPWELVRPGKSQPTCGCWEKEGGR